MGSHNVCSHCLQTIWIPITCALTFYKQYGMPYCAHSLNALFPYTKNWPEDGSPESKHVASYVLIEYICVVFD
jgi:hypothetical protein